MIMRKIGSLLLLCALGVLVAYPAFRKKDSGNALRGSRPATVVHVQVTPVVRKDIRQWIAATGDIVANASVPIYSEVEGELKRLLVDEGDHVTAGQTIAQIDPEELSASVEQAAATLGIMRAKAAEINAPSRPEELHKAKTQVEEAQVRMQRADADYQRQKKLFERNISSREDLDAAQMAHAVALAQLNVAKANLELVEKGARQEEREVLAAQVHEAEASVRLAELKLRKATIKAPITGIVSERYVDQGAHVDINKPIFNLVDMATVKAFANVPERDVANVRPGLRGEVEVDAHTGRIFLGEVRKISPAVAAASRTAKVEVAVPNKDLLLKPGMFARVRIVLGEKQNALVVPTDAIVRTGDPSQAGVYVVVDGKSRLRPVTRGLSQDSLTEITSGVQEGENVVSFGLMLLKDGMDVVVKDSPKSPGATGDEEQPGGAK